MDFERNPPVDKKFTFNIPFIMLLGFFLIACSNRSISNNNPDTDNSNQLEASISDLSEISDPEISGQDGTIDIEPLTDALEAEGFTKEEINDALIALILAIESSSDLEINGIDEVGLLFAQLMQILNQSQEEQKPNQSPRDPDSGADGNKPNAPSVSYNPPMSLSSTYLICPSIPQTNPVIPPGPYDVEIGDCVLRRKTTEVEAWLTELEQIAASCQAKQEANWTTALSARAYLDTKIDELEEMEPETPQDEEGEIENTGGTSTNTGVSLVLSLLQAVQGTGGSGTEGTSPSEGLFNTSSHSYTNILLSIEENVEIYCSLVEDLIKPLRLACIEINLYQEIQSPDSELYHSLIDSGMNDAQAIYDSADLFYTNTLQNEGWDGYRSTFDAASLDCPIDPQAPDTKFTFSQNAFCRRGPSSEYEKVATFLEGQVVQIEGRNHHDPRWWVVPNPGARGQCWVSDSTGAAEGPLEELEIVAPPPLIINPPKDDQPKTKTCSKDLGQSDCAAAGGSMTGGSTGAPYCDCP